MSKVFTTEITSDTLPSDNPLHQRLLKPYIEARQYVRGDLLEVGCGEGRGIAHLLPHVQSYVAIDKIAAVTEKLAAKYPNAHFVSGNIPPLPFAERSFDSVVTFQVIEHIERDAEFLKEIHRILRPGGILLLTTPNRRMTLTRNPWHIREYLAEELKEITSRWFSQVEVKGITGNDKVMAYYEDNGKSVQRITRWDVFKLQYRLPSYLLRIPYEMLNRMNRNRLQQQDNELVNSIHYDDYLITTDASNALDLFLIARK